MWALRKKARCVLLVCKVAGELGGIEESVWRELGGEESFEGVKRAIRSCAGRKGGCSYKELCWEKGRVSVYRAALGEGEGVPIKSCAGSRGGCPCNELCWEKGRLSL